MKQKISNIEQRLNTLSDVVQTLTNEFCNREVKNISNLPLDKSSLYTVSTIVKEPCSEDDSLPALCSDTESDDETDDESESGSETESENVPVEPVKLDLQEKKIEFIELNEPEEIIVVHKEESVQLPEPEVSLIQVSDDDVLVTKQIQVSVDDYSKLSLKDLKQKVNDLGGPPLKTKQALLNFLKNKV
jgi:hypothetical protein